MQANRALDAALALARNPGLAASMRSRPLPSGIPLLLQILADESEVALSVAQALRVNERSLRFAVEHYVETVMLFAGAEPTRVLGVATDASRAEMRTHLRWLMRWLHPDHNPAAWRSAFAGRVLTAWREASSPDAVAKAPQRRARGEPALEAERSAGPSRLSAAARVDRLPPEGRAAHQLAPRVGAHGSLFGPFHVGRPCPERGSAGARRIGPARAFSGPPHDRGQRFKRDSQERGGD